MLNQKQVWKSVTVGAFALGFAGAAQAALFEVGAGKTYATVQAAVDAAVAADDNGGAVSNEGQSNAVEIVVFAGTYVENVSIAADSSSKFNSRNDGWTIRNNSGDNVVITGGVSFGTDRDHMTLDGINVLMDNSTTGLNFSQTSRNNTIKNLWVFGGDATRTAVRQHRLFGTNTFDHVTLVGNHFTMTNSDNSTSVITNSIIAHNTNHGISVSGSNPTAVSFSDIFDNVTNFNPDQPTAAGDAGGNLGVFDNGGGLDPLFASLDPNNMNFLYLNTLSPAAGTANTAGSRTNGEFNMGALPTVIPEPGALALMGLGGLLMIKRRRA